MCGWVWTPDCSVYGGQSLCSFTPLGHFSISCDCTYWLRFFPPSTHMRWIPWLRLAASFVGQPELEDMRSGNVYTE